jgi:hypothetical protein
MKQQRSNAVITKHFVLAASMMVSDERYWRSAADQNAVKGPETTFDATEMPRGIEVPGPSYHGGPKENY